MSSAFEHRGGKSNEWHRSNSCRPSLGLACLISGGLLLGSEHTWATPPALYGQPAYESPVRGDPDDLLLLSGSGLSGADTIVYEAVANTTSLPPTPSSVPLHNLATQGTLTVINSSDAPYALAVHLSTRMTLGGSYALWVVSPDNEWSAPILINDARPLWITPDSGYQTASLANLPRTLKVVGRNLQPGPGASTVTQVRLVGVNTGTTYVVTANNSTNDPNTTAALERYVAAVNLPSPMTVDQYTVQVSRDGTSWVPLLGNGQSPAQIFAVNADPVAPSPAHTFSVANFSDPLTGRPCVANDGNDDTGCIILAIRAAQAAGGGTVAFGPGTWLVSQAGNWTGQGYSDRIGYAAANCPGHYETCGVSYFGLLVPVSVNLQGAGATGANRTMIERGTTWPTTMAVFTLQGYNTVSGFDFTDDNNYLANYANQTFGGTELQLGVEWYDAAMYGNDPQAVSNVVITNNVFDKPYAAINDRGIPDDHIYITYNTFGGAFTTAIQTGEDENNVSNLLPGSTLAYMPFTWSDSITTYNTFYPSSFQVTPAAYNSGAAGGNGSIATQFNTGLRVDMSNNVADGTATQYFYSPTDPKGWRAAFFWSNGASQEMTLVSNNQVSCSGDKYGDGEAIVYDGSQVNGGMPNAEPVVASVPWTDPLGIAGSSLTAQGVIVTQFGTSRGTVDLSANPTSYYQGYWLKVLQGQGKGQWRKVESVSLGTDATGATVTLNVTPAFDVPPDGSSKVVLDRGYWQNATVNNYIDQRTPLCTKANARDSGGILSWYSSVADSAMEGNQQYGTNGILLNHTYQPAQGGSTTVIPVGVVVQAYNEVRNNVISGAYDWSSAGTWGGIQLGFGATAYYCNNNTCPASPPLPTGFGVSIAGNTISQSSARDIDGVHTPIGGIGLNPKWSTGVIDPLGLAIWELDDDSLIFRNTLQNISNTMAGSAGGTPLVGIGIDVAQGSTVTPAVNWRATLYANSCSNVDIPSSDFGLSTTRYCPSSQSGSCECSGVATVDVGVTASASPASMVSAGGSATYTVTVTNNNLTTTASDVILSVTPSAGVTINSASFTSSQGTCDPSVNICMLGSLAASQSAAVTVTGTLPTSGTWPVTFSVTHHEYDGDPADDNIAITETVP